MSNDDPLEELSAYELAGPNHLCRTLIPSDAVVFEIRRRLERLAIVETELATAKSDRHGLLGLVRAELEDHCPKGEKMNLLDLTKAVLERMAKCDVALVEIERLTRGSQCGVSGVCDGLIGHLMEIARAALEGR